MDNEGPGLESLVHRLAECPGEFQAPSRDKSTGVDESDGVIDVAAIALDHTRVVSGDRLPKKRLQQADKLRALPAAQRQLVALVVWLLHDEWFLERPKLTAATWDLLLSKELSRLAQTVRPDRVLQDPDRREELVRVCLRALRLRPQGESLTQATDRLNTLDSVERDRVMRKTRDAEARARRVREKMAEKAAQEAAARYSPE